MRILVLPKDFPSERSPQAGIFVRRRVEALQAMGHELEVVRIVPHAPPLGAKWQTYRAIPAEEYVGTIRVRTIRAFFPPRMLAMEYLPLQVGGAIRREIARFRPDVLHASFLIPSGQIAVRQNVPTVVTAHGSDAYAWINKRAGLRNAAREAVQRAGRVTAVSAFIAGCVRQLYSRDVEVIWNGADERFFFPRDRGEARALLEIAADRPAIAFAGNLIRAKGIYDLVDAAAQLHDLRPLIAMAGAGPESEPLARYARERNVDLRLLGRLDSEGIARLFAASDIMTLPSHNEGLPNVVCEAMLTGCAVVATTAGGIPEIVQDGVTGLLVPPREPQRLASALRALAQSAEKRAELSAHARAFAQQHLTWAISAKKYDRVYRELAAAP